MQDLQITLELNAEGGSVSYDLARLFTTNDPGDCPVQVYSLLNELTRVEYINNLPDGFRLIGSTLVISTTQERRQKFIAKAMSPMNGVNSRTIVEAEQLISIQVGSQASVQVISVKLVYATL